MCSFLQIGFVALALVVVPIGLNAEEFLNESLGKARPYIGFGFIAAVGVFAYALWSASKCGPSPF